MQTLTALARTLTVPTKTLTVPTKSNRFGLSQRSVYRFIQTLRGKTPKAWKAPTLSARARKRNAWHAGHCYDGAVGTEKGTPSGDVLVTRKTRKPPEWLVETVCPDGTTLKMVLRKGAKRTQRKSRWLLTGPGITALFPSRRQAIRAASTVVEVALEEEAPSE